MRTKTRGFLLLLLMTALALCLSACGDGGGGQETVSTPKYMYSAETESKVEASMDHDAFSQLVFNGDNGYFAAGEKLDGNGDVVPCISFIDKKGKVEELEHYVPVSVETGNEDKRDYRSSVKIETLKLCKDGNLMVIENVSSSWNNADSDVVYGSDEYYESSQYENTWWIRILKDNGKEISSAQMQISQDDYVSFFSSVIDKNGNLLASRSGGLVAVRPDGSIAYSINSSNYVTSVATLSDGRVAALAYAGSGRQLRIIDCDTGSFTAEKISLGEKIDKLIDGAGEYDLYYTGGSAMYGYKLETQTADRIVSWIDCDIYSNNVNTVAVDGKGTIKALLKNYDSTNEKTVLELVNVKREAYSARKDKKHVKLASVSPDRTMMEYIIEFNRANKDVRVDLIDYSQYSSSGDVTEAYLRLATDISSGEIPDIIDLDSNIPYEQYAAAGSFIDLYPYLEKDSELSKGDFFENVLSALEVDGKLYMATAGFTVTTAAGASSVVGTEPGITYEEFLKALLTMPDGCEAFDVGYDRETALKIGVALEYSKFVDWSSCTCHFDTKEFADLLKFAAKFGVFDRENHEYTQEDDSRYRIMSGTQMMTQVNLSGVDYTVMNTDEMFGGDATLTGYPSSEGVGSVITISGGLAITSGCSDPDAAWQFIRTFFTEQYQDKQYLIPTSKKVFERKLAKLMEVKYERDDDGNYVLDANGERVKKSIGTAYTSKGEVAVYAMSEEQARKFRVAVAGATHLLNYDQYIGSIVIESSQAFFAKQKTAEECAKLIQNRVQIYMSERS